MCPCQQITKGEQLPLGNSNHSDKVKVSLQFLVHHEGPPTVGFLQISPTFGGLCQTSVHGGCSLYPYTASL